MPRPKPIPSRAKASQKLCWKSLTSNRDNETPRATSISGIDIPPIISAVLATHRGGVVSVTIKIKAAAIIQRKGVLNIEASDHLPDANAKPMVTFAVDIKTKTLIPSASPTSPNANKQSGRPIFPLLGNERAGRKAPISNLKSFNSRAPITRLTKRKIPKIPVISPNSPGETSRLVNVEKIKAGTPKFNVNIPTRVVSKGFPNRPHT